MWTELGENWGPSCAELKFIEENELRVNSQSNGVEIDQLLGELEITTDSTGTIDTITLTKDGNVITLYSAE